MMTRSWLIQTFRAKFPPFRFFTPPKKSKWPFGLRFLGLKRHIQDSRHEKREIIWPAFCLFLILPLFSPIGSNDQTRRCGALPVQGWLRLEGAEHHQVQLRPVEWSDPALRAGLLPVSGIHPGWKGRIFLFFWIIFLLKKYLCITEAFKFVTPNDISISWRFSRLKEGFEPLTTRMVFQTSTSKAHHKITGSASQN